MPGRCLVVRQAQAIVGVGAIKRARASEDKLAREPSFPQARVLEGELNAITPKG